MSLETYELDKLMQQYSISELRNIPEYVALCNAHAKGLSTVQQAADYLTNAFDINKAVGIWLDYIGWLEGTTRSYGDISKFFSVNKTQNVTFYAWANLSEGVVYTLNNLPVINDTVFSDTNGTILGTISSITSNTITVLGTNYTKNANDNIIINSGDLNEEKYFWFAQQSIDPNSDVNEEFFRRKILAKIQYNKTRCTRNDNINIIKGITFADHCIINKARVYDNYTVVGSPTITADGVASGFSSSNYVRNTNLTDIAPVTKTRVIKVRHIWKTGDNAAQPIVQGSNGRIIYTSTSGGIEIRDSQNVAVNTNITYKATDGDILDFTVTLNPNKSVNIKLVVNNTDTYTASATTANDFITNAIVLGFFYGTYLNYGSIDLKQFKIYVDDILVYRTYTEQPMSLNITLYGDDIISTTTMLEDIGKVLGNGVGINDLRIKGLSEYEET